MSKQPPPAPTASAVGPCPTVIQIVGRPSTGTKASQNKLKRIRENDSDTSENEHSQPTMSTASPRYLVIHSQEEKSISSLSPFVIESLDWHGW